MPSPLRRSFFSSSSALSAPSAFKLFSVISMLSVVNLPACSSSVPTPTPAKQPAPVEAAIASDQPPEDFWIGVTVLAPRPADNAIMAAAYKSRPRALRPARYIIEANRILRVGQGGSVTPEYYPVQTRTLTAEQMNTVWRDLRDSGLLAPGHPGLTGKGPNPEEVVQGSTTVYVVSFLVAGDHRTVVLDADGPHADAAADARRLVDRLADLAWIER